MSLLAAVTLDPCCYLCLDSDGGPLYETVCFCSEVTESVNDEKHVRGIAYKNPSVCRQNFSKSRGSNQDSMLPLIFLTAGPGG
jgi:hypothetical protein